MDSGMKEWVQPFLQLLQTCGDGKADVQKVIDFLGRMLRTKQTPPPPTAELITLLKHRKPLLYHTLKKSITPTSPIHFVLQLDMNYEAVLERLRLTSTPEK